MNDFGLRQGADSDPQQNNHPDDQHTWLCKCVAIGEFSNLGWFCIKILRSFNDKIQGEKREKGICRSTAMSSSKMTDTIRTKSRDREQSWDCSHLHLRRRILLDI